MINKLMLLVIIIGTAKLLSAQNVGIGTISPLARLHVIDSNVIFSKAETGADLGGYLPISGAGSRFMWIASKNAVRAGTVSANQWDLNNIGNWSAAFGYNTTASKNYTIALGSSAFAVKEGAVSIGEGTYAGGQYSLALGNFASALGQNSISVGYFTDAPAYYSTALGKNTLAHAYNSIAVGSYNDTVSGSSKIEWIDTDPLLYVGNGISSDQRRNALLIYKNGNTDINGFVKIGNDSINNNNKTPRVKTKKITGYTTPSSANPNTFTFIPHGINNPNKILSLNVLVTNGAYQFLPHSTEQGYIYTVNTDPNGGPGPSIAVGVKSIAQSSQVMSMPIKVFITYEE